ncbi:MAG TPA: hypothetical protein GXX20_07975 [Clostridiaceae bacterium]|nr:hypothetical protein [Clostridiaceae bacterium]
MKWLATILLIALVHIPVLDTANAVNVSHTTADLEKFQDVSFLKLVKKHMIGQLKISIEIIRRTFKYSEQY